MNIYKFSYLCRIYVVHIGDPGGIDVKQYVLNKTLKINKNTRSVVRVCIIDNRSMWVLLLFIQIII